MKFSDEALVRELMWTNGYSLSEAMSIVSSYTSSGHYDDLMRLLQTSKKIKPCKE